MMLLAAATLQSLQTALAQPVQPALQRLQVLQALRPPRTGLVGREPIRGWGSLFRQNGWE